MAMTRTDSTPVSDSEPRRVDVILGVPIDRLTESDALERILALAGTPVTPPPYVATVNVDFLVNTQSWWPGVPRHPELLESLREAALVTADGMPVVWASRLLGGGLPARVAGSDLVPMLARAAVPRSVSLYLLGGAGTSAQDAANRLVQQNPGLRIAGVDAPFVHVAGAAMATSDEDDQQICARINATNANVLLIGFGNPKQEIWFARNRHRLRVGVALGVGGTFNFLTGRVGRAPAWMQRTGLEWIYRLLAEPGRLWKRYAIGLLKYGCMMLPPLAVSSRRTSGTTGEGPTVLELHGATGAGMLVRLPAHLDSRGEDAFLHALAARQDGAVVILDARRVRSATAAGLGMLFGSARPSRAATGPVLLFAPSRALRRVLTANRAWDLWSGNTCADADALHAALRMRWPGFAYLAAFARENALLRVDVVGELAGEPMAELNRAVVADGLADRDLVLDCSCCARIDYNAAALLARLQRDLAARGHTLYLRGLSPALDNALRQAGLDQIPRQERAGGGGPS